MNIERTFLIPVAESEVRQRLANYFAQAGYQKTFEKGIGLSFRRGSKLGSWIGINPSQLLCLADIQVKPKGDKVEVRADFEIKTIIKDDTHFTEEFWNEELQKLETSMRTADYSSVRTPNLTLRALLAIGKSLINPFVFIVIWGGLSLGLTLLILRLPGFSSVYPDIVAVFSMIIAAIAILMFYRYWRKRRRQL